MDGPDDIVAKDLGITRLLRVFAVLSVLVLLALAAAPARSYFSEWRSAQRTYNQLARRAGLPEIPVAIRQIWRPELEVIDRCASCHLATDGAAPISGQSLFAAHPPIAHDPRQFGCTVCHGGQGRATSAAAAHGDVEHWDEPIFERGYAQAGCGTCHSGVRVGAAQLVDKGQKVVAETKCAGCHGAATAKGGAPDLSGIGLRGFRADWHAKHVERSASAAADAPPFTPLSDDEVAQVSEYLRAQIGAPRLMAAKALVYRRGCRGCHRINGVGGDDGPDLSNEGRKSAHDLDFANISGPHTLRSWLTEHFLNPPKVVPGSQMPNLSIPAAEADLLTLYTLSLRTRSIPEGLAPRDRVRAERLGERDFATDGESLFGVFCAACHGPRGEGRTFLTLKATFPAIGEPEFLAIADDDFLRKTINAGRPGRRMPAWGTKEGGLRPEEVDALVGHLRSLSPTPPTIEAVAAAPIDRAHGDALFAGLCAPCHGQAGAGSAVAPPLAAVDNPATHEDSRIYGTLSFGVAGTAMGSFRQLDAESMHSLIASVRALPPVSEKRSGWAAQKGTAERGAASYQKYCVRCHGLRGAGDVAPALGNAAFLAAATDGYLTATILRGRGRTAMPHFGKPETDHPQLHPNEVVDLVAYLRSLR